MFKFFFIRSLRSNFSRDSSKKQKNEINKKSSTSQNETNKGKRNIKITPNNNNKSEAEKVKIKEDSINKNDESIENLIDENIKLKEHLINFERKVFDVTEENKAVIK